VVLACAIVVAAGAAARAQTSRTYTTTADFQEGSLNNVNATVVADQLQLNVAANPDPFPVVNVAASGRGSLVRIDGATGAILGEYATSPDGLGRNPSRTATDAFGNVWVGNRNESGLVGGTARGSVVKIGICVGGTRVNADGTPNPNGLYLRGPFAYSTCVDRDGDGLIRTSRGLGDVLAWPNVTDGAGGADGIVQDAVDEAILVYQRTSGTNVHHVSLAPNGDVWVGGFPFVSDDYDQLDGQTGAILSTLIDPPCGAYGGVVDGNGVLWSTSSEGGTDLHRYVLATQTRACIDLTQFGPNNTGESHGLGIGPDGSIWVTQFDLNQVLKFDPAGNLVAGFPRPVAGDGRNRSVAVSADGHAWVDGSLGRTVTRLDSNGNLVKVIDLGVDGLSPRGMAVDVNGKIWTTCTLSNTAKRIDPSGGGDGLGAVDLTVSLGRNAAPFNFGEMTGANSVTVPQDNGTWEVLYDSQVVSNEYGRIAWTANVPTGTSFAVEFRTSDDPVAIQNLPFQPATNGAAFSGVFGRYVNVLATFTRPPGSVLTPVLFDLTIEGLAGKGPTDCPVGVRKPASLLVFPEFDSSPAATTLITVVNTNSDTTPVGNLAAGTVDVEYVYIGREGPGGVDLPCLETNFTRRLTPNDILTVVARAQNPNHERGFVYVFAKDPQTGQAIVFNHLIGNAVVLDGFSGADYGFEAYAYLGVGAEGTPTDDDGDGVRDLNGLEYSCAPDVLLFPRFFGQSDAISGVGPGVDYRSELVLLNLSGGTEFEAIVDFLLYNDNEEVFSAQAGFVCWTKRPLAEINSAFTHPFLASTNHAPLEVLGAASVETGWFRLDGRIAASSAAVVQDPAILALLVEGLPLGRSACDLPFESGAQTNGDLLLVGVIGDTTP
jgi:streptogramin lyase